MAIGGHLHGGARRLKVEEPACGRTLVVAEPTYATADDPLYAITPLLHEPDPKHISWSQSATGWGAPPGTRLRVTAAYDAERPHMRVMGIAHVYVARDPAPAAALRAAAGRRRGARRAVRRARPTRRRSTSRSPRSAATAARGRSTARPARSAGWTATRGCA